MRTINRITVSIFFDRFKLYEIKLIFISIIICTTFAYSY